MEVQARTANDFEAQDDRFSDSLLTGNRIPRDFFITSGSGESDICVHAGSYHLALQDAGIEKLNILTYSSVLPAIANQVERPESMIYGSVMETIMAEVSGPKNVMISAGIKLGWLYNRATGERLGGLVCEYSDKNISNIELDKVLSASLLELYSTGYQEDYELREEETIWKSFIPKKQHGTVLVSLCFLNYLYPIIKQP